MKKENLAQGKASIGELQSKAVEVMNELLTALEADGSRFILPIQFYAFAFKFEEKGNGFKVVANDIIGTSFREEYEEASGTNEESSNEVVYTPPKKPSLRDISTSKNKPKTIFYEGYKEKDNSI